ncbi:hypothetical protein [uncultured Deinococcus sp.]|uniref:hypothetical protein n=1 Tax=uncultured Deinococcus sp. TaxID=158789 RepID=UPI0025DC5BFD|nr:hypothetical protein [uncultured Deinococcus sp.]
MTTHTASALPGGDIPHVGPHDLKALSREVKALHARVRELAASDRLEELLKIIPRPGWTTPAEFELVRGTVAYMNRQVAALDEAQDMLLKGANLVGART